MLKRGLACVWLAALGALLLTASCSGDKAPRRGEIIVAFQTDLSIPKDITVLVVTIYVGGTKRYQSEFPLSPGGKFDLPATLAIIEGEQKAQPVTIRVTGLDGSRTPKVIRQAVSTIPSERIALMHMPLQFLCLDNDVKEDIDVDGTPSYVDKCTQQEQTCMSGECIPDEIDVNTLPDYAGDLVFGGAPLGSPAGQCLDVLGCFARGVTVSPDTGDCSVALPQGSEENVNVGLVLPLVAGGPGICGSQACIVALERDDLTGWKFENGRAILPKAVCNRLGADIDALAVTSGCVTKTPAIPTCGPWSGIAGDFTEDAGAPAEGGAGEGGSGDGGIDDPCSGAADGIYCNWEAVIGEGGEILRECKAGVTVSTTDCNAGGQICIDGGPAEFAFCGTLGDGGTDAGDAAPPGPCGAKPKGFFCDATNLVECDGFGKTSNTTACASGCTASGPHSYCNGVTGPLELGRACTKDAECAPLICLNDTGLPSGSGVAYGVCTTPCTPGQNSCDSVKKGAGCHTFEAGASYCLEACSPSDPTKCNMRQYEIACASLTDVGDNSQKNLCLPACSGDLDCNPFVEAGPPGSCSLQSGLCQSTPTPTPNIGADCSGTTSCADSVCSTFSWSGGTKSAQSCSAGCSLGNFCEYDPVAQVPPMMAGACIWPANPAAVDHGNLGQCLQLCGCQLPSCSTPGFQCNQLVDSATKTWVQNALPGFAEALQQNHQAEGYCGPPVDPAGNPLTPFGGC